MTSPTDRIDDITASVDAVVSRDLDALADWSASERVDRYERLADEEREFVAAFTGPHADFLTDAERARIRADIVLARLFLAASFDDESRPSPLDSEFSDRELQAVADFDRYKAFDALDPDGVADRIERMDGELYELVRDYHDTQLADLDALLTADDVHRDVMDRLADRYHDRLETVRAGVFAYVESHGLTRAMDEVESAVRATADAAAERRAATEPLDGRVSADDADALDSYVETLNERIERLDDTRRDLDALSVPEDSDAGAVVDAERERLDDARRDLTAARSRAALERDRRTAATPGETVAPVSASLARVFELDYLGRFDTSMRDADTLVTPDGSVTAPADEAGESAVRDARRFFENRDVDPDAMPRNRHVRYELGNDGVFSFARDPTLVVQVACHASLDAYVDSGFDDRPAGLRDVLDVLAPVVEDAERDDTHYLVAVASPTGWSADARETVTGDTPRSRFGASVSVCLVDLREGALHYDDGDPVVDENSHLFEHGVDDERIDECTAAVRERVTDPSATHVRLADVAADGYADRVVRRAFDRLAADGYGTVVDVEGHGLCLSAD
ncbi:hypothetical protein U3A55_08310 [Salarchaeum sp. III]|uniref:hypothetical protein n=1 Tax=Salarchaeum sp. III TaxID=3107927 RepID=UPI002EDB1A1F